MSSTCAFCKTVGNNLLPSPCERCGITVGYCDLTCLTNSWDSHKATCVPAKAGRGKGNNGKFATPNTGIGNSWKMGFKKENPSTPFAKPPTEFPDDIFLVPKAKKMKKEVKEIKEENSITVIDTTETDIPDKDFLGHEEKQEEIVVKKIEDKNQLSLEERPIATIDTTVTDLTQAGSSSSVDSLYEEMPTTSNDERDYAVLLKSDHKYMKKRKRKGLFVKEIQEKCQKILEEKSQKILEEKSSDLSDFDTSDTAKVVVQTEEGTSGTFSDLDSFFEEIPTTSSDEVYSQLYEKKEKEKYCDKRNKKSFTYH